MKSVANSKKETGQFRGAARMFGNALQGFRNVPKLNRDINLQKRNFEIEGYSTGIKANSEVLSTKINEDLEHALDDLEVDDDNSSLSDDSDQESKANGVLGNCEHYNRSHETFSKKFDVSPGFSQVNRNEGIHEHSDNEGYGHTHPKEILEHYDDISVGESKIQEYLDNTSDFPDMHTEFLQNHHSNPVSSVQSSEEHADIQEEYLKLQILYETTRQELEQIKRKEMNTAENANQDIRTLELKLVFLEGEKERISSSLQDSQNLINDFRLENSVLKGKLSAVELQLSSVTKSKDEAMSELESHKITVQALEKKISELNRSDTLSQLKRQNHDITEKLNSRHQKEVLKYKQVIDKLQSDLNNKTQNMDSLESKVSQIQQTCEQLQIEKMELFNTLSSQLEASQRQCQRLLQSAVRDSASQNPAVRWIVALLAFWCLLLYKS